MTAEEMAVVMSSMRMSSDASVVTCSLHQSSLYLEVLTLSCGPSMLKQFVDELIRRVDLAVDSGQRGKVVPEVVSFV